MDRFSLKETLTPDTGEQLWSTPEEEGYTGGTSYALQDKKKKSWIQADPVMSTNLLPQLDYSTSGLIEHPDLSPYSERGKD